MVVDWLRRTTLSWWLPLLLAALALAFDEADHRLPFSILGTGFLDEPAHAAMAALGLLVIAGFVTLPTSFYVTALIMSVAIDLDHIPIYLGDTSVIVGTHGRPFTHSLATVAVFVALAIIVSRWRYVFAGAAVGLLLHLARDVAEGGATVPLLWPLNHTGYAIAPLLFRLTVAALLVVRLGQVGRARHRSRLGSNAERPLESARQ